MIQSRTILLLLILVSSPLSIRAEDTRGTLDCKVSAFRGSAVDSSAHTVLAGSRVWVWSLFRFEQQDGLPANRYATWNPVYAKRQYFVESSGSARTLLDSSATNYNPRTGRSAIQSTLARQMLTNPTLVPDSMWRWDEALSVTIPASAIGKWLKFSVNLSFYDEPRAASNLDSVFVIAPQDFHDSLKILRSQTYFTYLGQDFSAGKKLADSLKKWAKWDKEQASNTEFFHESRFDKFIAKAVNGDNPLEHIWETIAPTPDPLLAYRDYIVEEESRRRAKPGHEPNQKWLAEIKPIAPGKLEIDAPHKEVYSGSHVFISVEWEQNEIADFVEFRQSPIPITVTADPCDFIFNPNPEFPTLSLSLSEHTSLKRDQTQDWISKISLSKAPLPKSGWGKCLCEHLDEYTDEDDPLKYQRNRWFSFSLMLPDDFPPETLVVTATYDHELFGKATAEQRLAIAQPDSLTKKQRVIESRMNVARNLNEHARILELADSAEWDGLLTPHGIDLAMNAAPAVSYDKALQYLDLKWHRVGIIKREFIYCGTGYVPRPQEPDLQRRLYLKMRSGFLHNQNFPRAHPFMRLIMDAQLENVDGRAVYRMLPNATASLNIDWEEKPYQNEVYEFFSASERPWRHGNFQIIVSHGDDLAGCFETEALLDSCLTFVDSPHRRKSEPDSVARPIRCNVRWYADTEARLFQVPDEFTSKYIRIEASYQDSSGWSVADSLFIEIVAPATRADSAEWYANRLKKLRGADKHVEAIELVDSTIARGDYFPDVLLHGWLAATDAGNYQKALDFLEAAWETNGYFEGNGITPQPHSEAAQQRYKLFKNQTIRRLEGRKVLGDGEIEVQPRETKVEYEIQRIK